MVEIREIPLNQILRPLPRVNDQNKVAVLMESIQAEGLHEPIDILEVDGQYNTMDFQDATVMRHISV